MTEGVFVLLSLVACVREFGELNVKHLGVRTAGRAEKPSPRCNSVYADFGRVWIKVGLPAVLLLLRKWKLP